MNIQSGITRCQQHRRQLDFAFDLKGT